MPIHCLFFWFSTSVPLAWAFFLICLRSWFPLLPMVPSPTQWKACRILMDVKVDGTSNLRSGDRLFTWYIFLPLSSKSSLSWFFMAAALADSSSYIKSLCFCWSRRRNLGEPKIAAVFGGDCFVLLFNRFWLFWVCKIVTPFWSSTTLLLLVAWPLGAAVLGICWALLNVLLRANDFSWASISLSNWASLLIWEPGELFRLLLLALLLLYALFGRKNLLTSLKSYIFALIPYRRGVQWFGGEPSKVLFKFSTLMDRSRYLVNGDGDIWAPSRCFLA